VICTIIFVLTEYFVAKKNNIQSILVQKNKDITDSITYAKRIQQAILPPDRLVKKLLPESFILYKPKDIVSGDFYWVTEWGNKVMFAAVDCTGHGVPGAFMSIVGQNILSQSVNEYGLSRPNLILNALNKGVSRTLGKDSDNVLRDGMDLALCAIDLKEMKMEFSGAMNPAWVLRDTEIIELKGNKFPIGSYVDGADQHFENTEFQLKKGDRIYVFTDGYADQFGGPKGKKFKYKNIKTLLLDTRHESMDRQLEILDRTIESWRGNLEQIDDILVMGVKI
jgi:serine phosphatase RsbU (regulator of sigma subunit)